MIKDAIMDSTCITVPYSDTGFFSKIILDYLASADELRPFYESETSLDALKQSIKKRLDYHTDRKLLAGELYKQYQITDLPAEVEANIELLKQGNTVTLCTAHQPALFTGNLYFVYKILHIIKFASFCKKEFPEYNFVPVFYMGSEDADLDELGYLYLNGEKIVWNTKQKGAVGRMKPKGLEEIINRLEGELGVLPFGAELIQKLRKSYLESDDIQTGCFKFLNEIFGHLGLVVLVPDNANLKRVMLDVFLDDLTNNTPSKLVEESVAKLGENYKVQANPRAINLFYLKDDIRDLIELEDDRYVVRNANISFSKDELLKELETHPERFSPNVILRGLFQEKILPNIIFVGGGGETAYWLELKKLFDHYSTPFPLLVLRNSLL